MKKLLLTGATGFIGSHVLDALLFRGVYDVHAVTHDTLSPQRLGVTWHQADLLNSVQTDCLMRDLCPDLLMHFAWYAVPGEYWVSNKNLDWAEASIHLIKSFYAYGGQRIVGAGTCAEYKWGSEILSESATALEPATLYGQSKLKVGELLDKYAREFDKSSAWGRIFFLYGPYEDPRRLVSSVICSLLGNKPALCTHCQQVRDFLYVKDVAAAFVALLESDVSGPVNIASGCAVKLQEIVQIAERCLGMEGQVKFGELPVADNECPVIVGDCHRLNFEVGWRPAYSFIAGLTETRDYWREMRRI